MDLMEDVRALLDSLMGSDRNSGKDGKKKSWKDDDVCKHHLVWECPHAMFLDQSGNFAAKSPLGPCKNQHSEAMKDRFKTDPDASKYKVRYLQDLHARLRKMVDEVDIRSQQDKKRLQAGGTSCSKETGDIAEGAATARDMLIKEKMEAAERMAAEGNVEISQKVMEQAEQLAKERKHLERVKEMADSWVDEICNVCGRQISWRAPEEIEARKFGRKHPHEMGIFHNGYVHARKTVVEIEEEIKKLRAEGGDREEREGSRDRSRGGDRDRKAKENGRSERSRSRQRDRRGDDDRGGIDRGEEKSRRGESRRQDAPALDRRSGTSRGNEDRRRDNSRGDRLRGGDRPSGRERDRTRSRDRGRSCSRGRDRRGGDDRRGRR